MIAVNLQSWANDLITTQSSKQERLDSLSAFCESACACVGDAVGMFMHSPQLLRSLVMDPDEEFSKAAAISVGTIGARMTIEFGRFVRWLFHELNNTNSQAQYLQQQPHQPSSQQIEINRIRHLWATVLLECLRQADTYTLESNVAVVMLHLQRFLEEVSDHPALLPIVIDIMSAMHTKTSPMTLHTHFTTTIDLVLAWALEPGTPHTIAISALSQLSDFSALWCVDPKFTWHVLTKLGEKLPSPPLAKGAGGTVVDAVHRLMCCVDVVITSLSRHCLHSDTARLSWLVVRVLKCVSLCVSLAVTFHVDSPSNPSPVFVADANRVSFALFQLLEGNPAQSLGDLNSARAALITLSLSQHISRTGKPRANNATTSNSASTANNSSKVSLDPVPFFRRDACVTWADRCISTLSTALPRDTAPKDLLGQGWEEVVGACCEMITTGVLVDMALADHPAPVMSALRVRAAVFVPTLPGMVETGLCVSSAILEVLTQLIFNEHTDITQKAVPQTHPLFNKIAVLLQSKIWLLTKEQAVRVLNFELALLRAVCSNLAASPSSNETTNIWKHLLSLLCGSLWHTRNARCLVLAPAVQFSLVTVVTLLYQHVVRSSTTESFALAAAIATSRVLRGGQHIPELSTAVAAMLDCAISALQDHNQVPRPGESADPACVLAVVVCDVLVVSQNLTSSMASALLESLQRLLLLKSTNSVSTAIAQRLRQSPPSRFLASRVARVLASVDAPSTAGLLCVAPVCCFEHVFSRAINDTHERLLLQFPELRLLHLGSNLIPAPPPKTFMATFAGDPFQTPDTQLLRAQVCAKLLLDFFGFGTPCQHPVPPVEHAQDAISCRANATVLPTLSEGNSEAVVQRAADECARWLIFSRLALHGGSAKQTFEGMLQLLAEHVQFGATPTPNPPAVDTTTNMSIRASRLVALVFALQRHIEHAINGSMWWSSATTDNHHHHHHRNGIHHHHNWHSIGPLPDSVHAFFVINHQVCRDWITKASNHALALSTRNGLHAHTIRIGLAHLKKMCDAFVQLTLHPQQPQQPQQRLPVAADVARQIEATTIALETACVATEDLHVWSTVYALVKNACTAAGEGDYNLGNLVVFAQATMLRLQGKTEQCVKLLRDHPTSPTAVASRIERRIFEVLVECYCELCDWPSLRQLSGPGQSTLRAGLWFPLNSQHIARLCVDSMNATQPLIEGVDAARVAPLSPVVSSPTEALAWAHAAVTLALDLASQTDFQTKGRALDLHVACVEACSQALSFPHIPNKIRQVLLATVAATTTGQPLTSVAKTPATIEAPRVATQEWWRLALLRGHQTLTSPNTERDLSGKIMQLNSSGSGVESDCNSLVLRSIAEAKLAMNSNPESHSASLEFARWSVWRKSWCTNNKNANKTSPMITSDDDGPWHACLAFVLEHSVLTEQPADAGVGNEDAARQNSQQYAARAVWALTQWHGHQVTDDDDGDGSGGATKTTNTDSTESRLRTLFSAADADLVSAFLALCSTLQGSIPIVNPNTAIKSWANCLRNVSKTHSGSASTPVEAALELLALLHVHCGLAWCENALCNALDTTPTQVWVPIFPQLLTIAQHVYTIGWTRARVHNAVLALIDRLCHSCPSTVADTIAPLVHGGAAHSTIALHARQCLWSKDAETVAMIQDHELLTNEMVSLSALWEERLLAILHATLTSLETSVLKPLEDERARLQSAMQEGDGSGSGDTNGETRTVEVLNTALALLRQRYTSAATKLLAPLQAFLAQEARLTPHDRQIQVQLLPRVWAAILRAQHADSSMTGSLFQAWAPLRSLLRELRDSNRGRKLRISDVQPRLASTRFRVVLPGTEGVAVVAVKRSVAVFPTKSRPKKIQLLGENGQVFTYLLKGREDVTLDARVMQFLQFAELVLREDFGPSVRVRSYAVMPLAHNSGLIRFVDNVTSVYALLKNRHSTTTTAGTTAPPAAGVNEQRGGGGGGDQQRSSAAPNSAQQQGSKEAALPGGRSRVVPHGQDSRVQQGRANSKQRRRHQRDKSREPTAADQSKGGATNSSNNNKRTGATTALVRPSEHFFGKLHSRLRKMNIGPTVPRSQWPVQVLREVFLEMVKETPSDLLSTELLCSCRDAQDFLERTSRFALSMGTMCMLGHILGVGDRHLENILVDWNTAELVHIDFNVCFDQGLALRVPEGVPFRLTHNFVTALGVGGVEHGMFRTACNQTMASMNRSRRLFSTLLDTMTLDPGMWQDEAVGGGKSHVVAQDRMAEDATLKLLPAQIESILPKCFSETSETIEGEVSPTLRFVAVAERFSSAISVRLDEDNIQAALKTNHAALEAANLRRTAMQQRVLHLEQAFRQENQARQAVSDLDAEIPTTNSALLLGQQLQQVKEIFNSTSHHTNALEGELRQLTTALADVEEQKKRECINQTETAQLVRWWQEHAHRETLTQLSALLHTLAVLAHRQQSGANQPATSNAQAKLVAGSTTNSSQSSLSQSTNNDDPGGQMARNCSDEDAHGKTGSDVGELGGKGAGQHQAQILSVATEAQRLEDVVLGMISVMDAITASISELLPSATNPTDQLARSFASRFTCTEDAVEHLDDLIVDTERIVQDIENLITALQRVVALDEQDDSSPQQSSRVCGFNMRALASIHRAKRKLNGFLHTTHKDSTLESAPLSLPVATDSSIPLGVQQQVHELISSAIEPNNLCRMFEGWTPWI